MNEEQLLKMELQKCDTIGNMLKVLQDRYDLHSCKVGILSKPIIVDGLVSTYKMLKPIKK